MTRFKFLFAALVVTAIVAVVPAALAQTAHVVGLGSSAQFLGTVTGADALASSLVTSGNCVYHWTYKNGMEAHDNRDSRINDEVGSVGIVWIAAQDAGTSCPGGTAPISSGNNSITDVWLIGQYDSTLGVRLFSAQQKSCSSPPANSSCAATVYLVEAANTGGANLVSPSALYTDNASDVALPANLLSFVGSASPGNLHVNMGLTDIRPEDALYATTRTLAKLNTTTWAGLGYVGVTSQIGEPIFELSTLGSHVYAPIGFGLSGVKDPINTAATVPAYTTIPVGAAPIVFVYNNGGSFSSSVANLVTGVSGTGAGSGPYYASKLFDGTTSCDSTNKAFGGSGLGGGTTINLILREPLSGTMNTTEFNVFRTTGNTDGSQEQGITNPYNSPYNPLNLPCAGGGGSRWRAIGTGDVLKGVNLNTNALGYTFFSFANADSVNGSAANQSHYNYLTVDGVDPLGLPGTTNQELPYCPISPATSCPASLWAPGLSYPTLRNGTYKVWSLYRWVYYNSNTDTTAGPTALAASLQNVIDSANSNADFVPFTNSSGDGLSVYRSHFTQSGVDCSYTATTQPNENLCDGSKSTETATTPSGATLGGGTEKGGDVGGVIIGWDYATVTVAAVTTGACHTAGAVKVTHTAGRDFGFSGVSRSYSIATAAKNLLPLGPPTAYVYIAGTPVTVSSCILPSDTVLYVTGYSTLGAGQAYSEYIPPTADGVETDDNGNIGLKN